MPKLVNAFLKAKIQGRDVDVTVLTDKNVSELGRFAVTKQSDDIGAFKTPTIRNIEVTAPYMHDGKMKPLRETVTRYNNGDVTKEGG